MKKIISVLCTLAVTLVVTAKGNNKSPLWPEDHKVRISWDASTFQELRETYVSNLDYIEHDFYYPRAKRISDGTILLSYSNHHYGWDIYVNRSEDDGKTWSNAINIAHSYPSKLTLSTGEVIDDMIVYVNPDFTELQDGRIIMAFQWRFKSGYGDLPKTNENCGIMVSFSEDKGCSWSEPKEVYRGRCWEPSFLQIPSGEIQMYITSSQDIKDETSFPRTVVIRSFDGGKTWQGKETCGIYDNEAISRSYDDRFCYDGMPTGVLLNDNKGIVVPLESWHGKYVVDQTPIVVKTTMEENWRIDQQKILKVGGPDYPNKKEINKDLQAYGPYGSKLPTGEVLVLCNGTYKGVQSVWVLVGDKMADNFHFATSPFTDEEYWGCIDYIGDNKVLASATYKYKGWNDVERAMIRFIKGRLNYEKEITKGELTLAPIGEFNRESNNFWFLGKNFDSQMFVDFGYTNQHLTFGGYLFDKKITSFTPENSDAIAILFSRQGGKNYAIVVNADGKYILYEEERYSWHLIDSGITKDVEVVGTINNDKDIDLGYSAKVSIPWKLIGGKPTKGEEIKVHLRRFYKETSKEKPLAKVEDLEGENSDYPQEWLSVKLN